MKKILIIGLVYPEPSSTAAGQRMMQLIRFFKDQSYTVVFGSTASKNEFSFNLENLEIETVSLKLNHPSFDKIIENLNPDIVLFDRFIAEEQFGWRVAEICPLAMRILDTEDLHCLRKGRENAFKKGIEFDIRQLYDLDITKREIASIFRCDLTLMISTVEMEILKGQFNIPKKLLHYLPFLVEPIPLDSKPNFEQRGDFVTIGNFKHEPNWQSIIHLKTKIWPLIHRALPEVKMLIYGAYADKKAQDLHNESERFFIMGRAENAHQVISQARLLLAPLQFGAGLKGKLLDAMLCGTPSITSSIGAEGMCNDLPWNGAIIDDPEKFASTAVELYNDQDKFDEFQQNGLRIVNELFSFDQLTELRFRIDSLQGDLLKHRQENFTGTMLRHHSLQSTKYLAKWIEDKEKF